MPIPPHAKPERNAAFLRDHVAGEDAESIGRRYGITGTAVRAIVVREKTRHINNLELALMVAKKADQLGQPAAHPTFLVPFQEQDGWRTALSYFQWSLDQLRSRGLAVTVETRQTRSGTAFTLIEEDKDTP